MIQCHKRREKFAPSICSTLCIFRATPLQLFCLLYVTSAAPVRLNITRSIRIDCVEIADYVPTQRTGVSIATAQTSANTFELSDTQRYIVVNSRKALKTVASIPDLARHRVFDDTYSASLKH